MDDRWPFFDGFVSTGDCGRIAALVSVVVIIGTVTAGGGPVVNVTFFRTAVICRAVDARLAASTSL